MNRRDTVLFIDARHIYRQVDRAHRDWTPAQIGFIANLVRLYRGEALDFTQGGKEAQTKLKEVFSPSPLFNLTITHIFLMTEPFAKLFFHILKVKPLPSFMLKKHI